MGRETKAAIIDDLAARTKGKTLFFTGFQGMNAVQMSELRAKLGSLSSEYQVIKHTLARLAFHKIQLEGVDQFFTGPTALVMDQRDPVEVARVLVRFGKDNEKFTVRGGVLSGKIIDSRTVNMLASLPGRQMLLTQVATGLKAPIVGLVVTTGGILRGLINALDALRAQRAQQPGV